MAGDQPNKRRNDNEGDIHFHLHLGEVVTAMFHQILGNQRQIIEQNNFIIQKLEKMDQELVKLEGEVSENGDAIDSAVTLLEGLAKQLRDNAGNAVKINALADQLDANSKRLAQAVTDNTPAGNPGTPTDDGGTVDDGTNV